MENLVLEILEIQNLLIKNVGEGKISIVDLCIKIQRNRLLQETNDILRKALVVTDSDSEPNALEAIAIQLGYKQRGMGYTTLDLLGDINEAIEVLSKEKKPQP